MGTVQALLTMFSFVMHTSAGHCASQKSRAVPTELALSDVGAVFLLNFRVLSV